MSAISFLEELKKTQTGEYAQKWLDEAINALKQEPCEDKIIDNHYWKGFHNGIRTEKFRESKREPCEDAVSRAEVIDELNRLGRNAFKDDTDYDRFFAFLDNLLPATPTQRWISVSERLPKNNGVYLVTIVFDIDETESERDVTKAYFCSPSKKWQYFSNNEVIAWMPLPEPYKAEMRGERE